MSYNFNGYTDSESDSDYNDFIEWQKSNIVEYKNDNDVLLLSHTVMPWTDSIPVLNAYAKRNNINDKKWNLVTGNKNKLYSMARNGYFADEDFKKTKDESEFIHTENFVLVDKKGRIRGVYNGTLALDIRRLKRHIEILKKEI